MGLGKTFQVICTLHAFMSAGHPDEDTGLTSKYVKELVLPAGRRLPKVPPTGPHRAAFHCRSCVRVVWHGADRRALRLRHGRRRWC